MGFMDRFKRGVVTGIDAPFRLDHKSTSGCSMACVMARDHERLFATVSHDVDRPLNDHGPSPRQGIGQSWNPARELPRQRTMNVLNKSLVQGLGSYLQH